MAYLVLSDGTAYEGRGIGYSGEAVGEVVFNTGMTGYQELLTDPSYTGQIVCMTYPLIGNCGVNAEDVESDAPKVRGFIVRNLCEAPSNWRSEGTLNDYLIKHKIVGLEGIDTRALTKKIRDGGTMSGIIAQTLPDEKKLAAVKAYAYRYPVGDISVKTAYETGGGDKRVAVIDYGLKNNILASLKRMGCRLKVFPSTVSAEEVLAYAPDGIMLTNGPGDPKENVREIETVKKLIGKKPMFGICLGHQLIALALGGDTQKLPYGHRGANHPVKDTATGKLFITSQNHGYAVRAETLAAKGTVSYLNYNDGTCEGMRYNDGLTFSVQFHPEVCPGPRDTAHLFTEFKDSIDAFSKQ
ncbi:MAG: carbamoyl phosphate synthase small subunit [Clostridiales bacterium]|jgi:carbamoyl-phosphate synthase small subunit|nr:carbamoyl phosphate synthase small subunit [Clostridiales bacterium]